MLLEELIDVKQKHKDIKDDWYNDPIPVNGNIGVGSFATVSKDLDDPHMVKRQTHHQLRPTKERTHEFEHRLYDGFTAWAQFIVDNKLADKNPYFPRIYEIEKITDKGDNVFYNYKIEKLYPTRTLSKKELAAIGEKISGKPLQYAYQIDYYLDEIFYNDAYTPDEQLIEVKKYLSKFEEDTGLKVDDLGGNNILVRRTSLGVHLVINDPVFGKD